MGDEAAASQDPGRAEREARPRERRSPGRGRRSRLAPALVTAASRLPAPVLLAMRPAIASALGASPLRGRLRRSLTAALGPDGFSRQHLDAYFRLAADQAVFMLIAYRSGIRGTKLASQWELDGPSFDQIQAVLAEGKGALMIGPHFMCHEMVAGATADRLPLSMLARRSADPHYQSMKERWYAGLGAELVLTPGTEAARMMAVMRVLRRNRVLAITPDLVQRPGRGIPVQMFDRTVELPRGAFFLAVRTRAAFIPCYVEHTQGRYRAWVEPVLEPRRELGDDAAIAELAQRWASQLEAFLRRRPEMWQFWLDKRWSQWLEHTPPVRREAPGGESEVREAPRPAECWGA